jgi:hypothetical protein
VLYIVAHIDMPFQNRFCTYRQSRTYLEKHCRREFLTDEELGLLLGGSAQRVLQIPEKGAGGGGGGGGGGGVRSNI